MEEVIYRRVNRLKNNLIDKDKEGLLFYFIGYKNIFFKIW